MRLNPQRCLSSLVTRYLDQGPLPPRPFGSSFPPNHPIIRYPASRPSQSNHRPRPVFLASPFVSACTADRLAWPILAEKEAASRTPCTVHFFAACVVCPRNLDIAATTDVPKRGATTDPTNISTRSGRKRLGRQNCENTYDSPADCAIFHPSFRI
ncbi:hypothetical protein GGI43DRAFT_88024 [Trichoderma evansii]